jgi:hypothetical protein
LATKYFRFRFQPPDAAAVETVAAGIDTVYTLMRQDLGLPAPEGMLEIEIDPFLENLERISFYGDAARLPSPGLLWLDPELSEAEVLMQWLLGPLERLVWEEAMHQTPARNEWWSLLAALENWHARRYSILSTHWHKAFVGWAYGKEEPEGSTLAHVCQEQRIKTRVALFYNIPPTGIYLCSTEQQVRRPVPSHLLQLPAPYYIGHIYPPQPWSWEQFVTLETLLDCTMTAHERWEPRERKQMSALIQAMHDYRTWDELILAVFDVTREEFEAGWQSCLQALHSSA